MFACMGGWCNKREHCGYYVAEEYEVIAERLCEPETADAYKPIVWLKEVLQ
jgi:hypothetical protein